MVGLSFTGFKEQFILKEDVSSMLLFNRFWNSYRDVSKERLPLWNFQGFDRKQLGLKCA